MASGITQPQSPEFESVLNSLGRAISHRFAAFSELRTFASQGDDEEVRDAFASHANELHEQILRLRESFGSPEDDPVPKERPELAWTPAPLADSTFKDSVIEEQTLRHLLLAYTASTGLVALSEALRAMAVSNGKHQFEAFIQAMQGQDRGAVEKYWHLLATRTKLAYNMLTVSEIDPAVETKVADDRLLS